MSILRHFIGPNQILLCRSFMPKELCGLRHLSDKKPSPRMEEFKKKLREKTPIGKLDEPLAKHPFEEKEPLEPWPNNTNPHTGEVGGPRGPEPTRYGDWERKGRVTDF